jgi:hypothetical protein
MAACEPTMDNTAQDFARKILAAVERAVHLLSRIEPDEPAKNPEGTVGHQNPSDQAPRHQQPPSAIPAELKMPAALVKEDTSSNRKDEYWKRKSYRIQFWTMWATAAAFGAAGVYALISQRQLITMREQFARDQRPYVIPTHIAPEQNSHREELAPGQIIQWRIESLNYGRSPAVNMTGNDQIFFGSNAEAEVDKYFKQLPKVLTRTGGSQGFRAPNGLGEPGFTTAQAHKPLAESDITFIKTHDFGIFVAGRIQYEDMRGKVYSTDFCYSTFLTGAIPMCLNHNEIR